MGIEQDLGRRLRVLVVDDDPKFREYTERGLRESGVTCRLAANSEEALEELAQGPGAVDLILLDVMMPGRSGWELLEELRRSGVQVPVIFLTARHEVEERVRGLRLGADDYVIKPFEFPELLARIEAVVRRRLQVPSVHLGPLEIDLQRRTVQSPRGRIAVTPQEFDLLMALYGARGDVLSRRELLLAVWGLDFDPGTNLVQVQIARLRKKLGGDVPDLIETVVGSGYRIVIPESCVE